MLGDCARANNNIIMKMKFCTFRCHKCGVTGSESPSLLSFNIHLSPCLWLKRLGPELEVAIFDKTTCVAAFS